MARRIAAGLYVDDRNVLHVDVPELLVYFGYPDTPENRDLVTEVAIGALQEAFPTVLIDVVDAESNRQN